MRHCLLDSDSARGNGILAKVTGQLVAARWWNKQVKFNLVRQIRPRSTLAPGSSYISCRFRCRLFCDFLAFSVRDAVRVDRFNAYQKLKLAKSKLKLAKSNPSRLDRWSAREAIL